MKGANGFTFTARTCFHFVSTGCKNVGCKYFHPKIGSPPGRVAQKAAPAKKISVDNVVKMVEMYKTLARSDEYDNLMHSMFAMVNDAMKNKLEGGAK
jgi:hypothetical protein